MAVLKTLLLAASVCALALAAAGPAALARRELRQCECRPVTLFIWELGCMLQLPGSIVCIGSSERHAQDMDTCTAPHHNVCACV